MRVNMLNFAELIALYWYVPLLLILAGVIVWVGVLVARGLRAKSKGVRASEPASGCGLGTLLTAILLAGAIGFLVWMLLQRYL